MEDRILFLIDMLMKQKEQIDQLEEENKSLVKDKMRLETGLVHPKIVDEKNKLIASMQAQIDEMKEKINHHEDGMVNECLLKDRDDEIERLKNELLRGNAEITRLNDYINSIEKEENESDLNAMTAAKQTEPPHNENAKTVYYYKGKDLCSLTEHELRDIYEEVFGKHCIIKFGKIDFLRNTIIRKLEENK